MSNNSAGKLDFNSKQKKKFIPNYSDFVINRCLFLFQSAKHEETLGVELQSLKDQVNLKRSSMNEHVSHLESLREEVSKLFT